jgi:hypothetical protein
MMAPRTLYDDGGSQPPLRKQEDVSKDSTALTAILPPGSKRSSDGHDTTRTGSQNLSGCHDGMYLGR